MSGPGKTPAERAAADPSTESEAPGLLGTVGAIARQAKLAATTHHAGHAHSHGDETCLCTVAGGSEFRSAQVARPTTVYEAAQLGDVASLVEFVGEREAAGIAPPTVLGAAESNGLSPWLVAAWQGHTTALRWMLEQGAATDAVSDNAMGASAAHLAICGGHFETLHFLLECGDASVDAQDKQQCTPLIVAAQYGEIMCAHLLLRHGADPLAVDENGDTAMHWVAYKGHYEFVRLLANGTAATPPWSEMLKERQPLLDASFNVDLVDNNGQTPLHLAASRGSVRVVNRLCDLGANISTTDKKGRTPVEAATENLSKQDFRLRCVLPSRVLWDSRAVVDFC